MDSLGAMALGGEPALREYMNEKPKSRNQAIVTKDMMIQVGAMGAFMAVLSLLFLFVPMVQQAFGEAHLTGYFALFMLMAVFNGFNVRSTDANIFKGLDENKTFAKVMLAIVAILVVLTFIGGEFLAVVPMTIAQWALVTFMAITVIPVGCVLKTFVLKNLK